MEQHLDRPLSPRLEEGRRFMEQVRILLFCLSTMLSSFDFSQTREWRSIVPLKSTRADVEKLLGIASKQCRCAYYSEEINVFVVYAEGDCRSGGTAGWNVPPDTVIRFDVVPGKERNLSKLGINLEKYTKMDDPEVKNAVYYFNEVDGITIAMNKVTNEVLEIHFGPTAEQKKDSRLRCPNSPSK